MDPAPQQDTDATYALILGAIGLVACQLLSPVAVFFAIRHLRRTSAEYPAKPEAIVGLVLGIVGSLIFVIAGAIVVVYVAMIAFTVIAYVAMMVFMLVVMVLAAVAGAVSGP